MQEQAYYRLFLSILAYSSLVQPIPVYSSIVQSIPTYSSLFQLIPAYPAYSSLFQPIPSYASLFQPISKSPISNPQSPIYNLKCTIVHFFPNFVCYSLMSHKFLGQTQRFIGYFFKHCYFMIGNVCTNSQSAHHIHSLMIPANSL